MATNHYDVVIIGGGNAGFGVTVPVRKAGLSVAMIEERDLGGTCPNRGCTPKKILVAAAKAMDVIARAKAHGIRVGKPKLDWAKLIDREKRMVAHVPPSLAKTARDRGVDVIRGHARFIGPSEVAVGRRRLEASHIVIAAGSGPRRLPFEGSDLLITSEEVLSERKLPKRVVFVGGGVIAFEFAHVYARAGAKVTILEVAPRVLGNFDQDAVRTFVDASKAEGIRIETGVEVLAVTKERGGLAVRYRHEGRNRRVLADRVVNGAGRVANVEGLDLDAGEVEHKDGKVTVDRHLMSVSNPRVHVCGDALWSSPQLSPLATYEGKIVGRNIAEGPKHAPDYSAVPSCVYGIPALSTVGLSEEKAREQGLSFRPKVNDMSDWFSAKTYAEPVSWSKVLIEEGSERVLGAHLVGHEGEELINLLALAMKHGIPASALKELVYAFPSFSADLPSML